MKRGDCELMNRRCPAIIGVGRTKFGEQYEREPEKLVEEAGLKALDSAGVERKDLDACYFSDYFLQITNKIGIEEGFLSELLELHVPMEKMRSFSSALLNAHHAVRSGKYGKVLVGGVEKMTDRWDKIRDDLMILEDPWSYYAGCTPEANHELMLREYVKRYGISGESLEKFNVALAQISVKNHHHAVKNEYAQFRREISLDRVLKERSRARKPLGLYDFAPISDGATALILASPKIAKAYSDIPIYIIGSSSATDYVTFPARENRTGFIASAIAMKNALKTAGIQVSDIQIAELYDQSTLLEMVSLEDMGFSERGKAWLDIHNSRNHYEGFYEISGKRLFVNTNGGLKADGNPLGATGGAQIFEVVKQLRGEAGERQVDAGKDLRFGCVLELEGFGTKAYVHLLMRD
ncbi:MAG: acetyl-CoA acetyltransferase [Candidatus Bathyarchaeota archaeon BA1]|nr:MAG: acetyl-CoA acetyltransferase [Candidatus Bathyarchaeota archaeon BA1]